MRLIGKKEGMTQLFDKEGNLVPCTVIYAEPNVVTQIKKKETDGYEAVQLAAFVKKKNVCKPLAGHYKKAAVEPRWYLKETLTSEEFKLGQEIPLTYFTVGDFVDVRAKSKGKGYQGVMKLFNFSGMRKSHGAGPVHRHAGSTGMRTTPGRCFPGGKRASRMGGDMVTAQHLEVVHVDEKRQLLLVRGAVPGFNGTVVVISKAIK